MTITIRFQNNYGAHVAYPVCNKAKMLLELTGKRTFSPSDLRIIQDLGYVVTVQSEHPVPRGWDFVIA
jgi:hypothetical protein